MLLWNYVELPDRYNETEDRYRGTIKPKGGNKSVTRVVYIV